MAGTENEGLPHLLQHRARLVQLRSGIKNQLDALAKDEGVLKARVWSLKQRERIESLPLPVYLEHRCQDLLELLDDLERRIKPLDQAVAEAAENDAQVILNVFLKFVRVLAQFYSYRGRRSPRSCG